MRASRTFHAARRRNTPPLPSFYPFFILLFFAPRFPFVADRFNLIRRRVIRDLLSRTRFMVAATRRTATNFTHALDTAVPQPKAFAISPIRAPGNNDV